MNDRGVSIVGVLVASSVAMVMLAGVTTMMSNLGKEQKRIMLTMDASNAQNFVQMVVNNSASCKTALGGTPLDAAVPRTDVVFKPLSGTGSNTLAVGTQMGEWIVDEVFIEPGAAVPVAGGLQFTSLLTVKVHTDNTYMPLAYRNKVFTYTMNMVTNGGAVTECSSKDNTVADACNKLGGRMDLSTDTCIPNGTGTLDKIRKDAVSQVCKSMGPNVGVNGTGDNCVYPYGSFATYVAELAKQTVPPPAPAPAPAPAPTTKVYRVTACSLPPCGFPNTSSIDTSAWAGCTGSVKHETIYTGQCTPRFTPAVGSVTSSPTLQHEVTCTPPGTTYRTCLGTVTYAPQWTPNPRTFSTTKTCGGTCTSYNTPL